MSLKNYNTICKKQRKKKLQKKKKSFNFHSRAFSVKSPASRVQRPESSVQSPASRVQRSESNVQGPESRAQSPTFASRVQEFRYAERNNSQSFKCSNCKNLFPPCVCYWYNLLWWMFSFYGRSAALLKRNSNAERKYFALNIAKLLRTAFLKQPWWLPLKNICTGEKVVWNYYIWRFASRFVSVFDLCVFFAFIEKKRRSN